MEDQNKNLILAIALSAIVMLSWSYFFPAEPVVTDPNAVEVTEAVDLTGTGTVAAESGQVAPAAEVAAAPVEEAPRIDIQTARVSGSLSLRGGRIDDLRLNDYRETQAEESEVVTLLSPDGSDAPYYAQHGWRPLQGGSLAPENVPGPATVWGLENGEVLTPETPVTLIWDNGVGQVFRRTISVDEDYMFTIRQSVTNNGEAAATLAPYGLIARHGEPQNLKGFFILHEGAIRNADGILTETDYDDITSLDHIAAEGSRAEVTQVESDGWIGFTDHYWMTTLIPGEGQSFAAKERYIDGREIYIAETLLPTVSVAAGSEAVIETRLFAGAKEWETIRNYQKDEGVTDFLESIDWGWFSFFTKPIFWLLHTLNGMIGNMGWAIIALTIVIKAIVLPLAYKSYVSMARMKEIQPEMEKLKERCGDDRQKMQQEMMKLYKEKKVNPAAGCLPILVQIPIFFSLYKVIFVTLELRHAAWIGWIRDLSAPDPSSIFNFFGIFPWAAPTPESLFALVFIGVMPIALGISMWLQQKLNPAPTDPTQQMIFAWMPWVFMFMLGGFASGLVLYWIANNTITFIQQYAIMRSHGHKPDIFGNIRSGFKKREKNG
ncbi:membrane protein insertase YidC [Halocynthiibacter styelae]|uniref:Membrane protein insertase YidC n=1 Tax=Halocynthiibacter styelae TaxID=2761955 RepID=A0A8J7LKN7_9RHOB|nr:membrane protein insertase YidC [Paenihalocynthiibacter styelae]MBI1494360.1 membrane protein insertase YidC [Paenihalocynthiibacter styelae]